MRILAFGMVALALTATACSNKSPDEGTAMTAQPTPPPPPVAPTPATAAPTTAAAKPVAELKLASLGNTMTFDQTALTVSAGQRVHLTFTNASNMELLPHNWVLVKPGTEAAVAAAGLKVGPTAGYIDVGNADIITSSPVAKKGTTVELNFTAPAAGAYPYICTVPGHYLKMKGVLTVTP